MTDTQVDLAAVPELRGAREVGTTADGEALLLSLETVGGAVEHFAIHHGRVAALIASLLFASGVAAKARGAAASGGAPGGEGSALIDIVRLNASSAPGADFIALRLVVGDGANLDFRIPLDAVPALQARMAGALSVAQQRPAA